MQLPTFTNVRVFILLCVLGFFSFLALHQSFHTRSWVKPLEVVVLPVNGDEHIDTDAYINSLSNRNLQEIEAWFKRESSRYDLALEKPVEVRLGPQVFSVPPAFPENPNFISVVFWGLRFRLWAFLNTPEVDSSLTLVRMFVVYHQGEDNIPLKHSLGMKKGLLGLVHAYALSHQTAQNNIVIAHEMLHVVGAIDKYEKSGAPIYPIGYANPQRVPLFPQSRAEIMAGRIPASHTRAYMANSLNRVIINEYTANEINWKK